MKKKQEPCITLEQVREVYKEADRRLNDMVSMEDIESPEDYFDTRNMMLQGIYSALMVLSGKDWPDVRRYTDQIEAEIWKEEHIG